jgi:hypothetical protein
MRYELADFEWAAIRPMLPNKPRGIPRVNDRRVLNGIFCLPTAAVTCGSRLRRRKNGVQTSTIEMVAVHRALSRNRCRHRDLAQGGRPADGRHRRRQDSSSGRVHDGMMSSSPERPACFSSRLGEQTGTRWLRSWREPDASGRMLSGTQRAAETSASCRGFFVWQSCWGMSQPSPEFADNSDGVGY